MTGTNVQPLWSGKSGAVPPSCFSELAALGNCYNQIQALTALLTQIVTDIIETDPDVQQAIVDAIMSTGSNVPLIGVTNGAAPQAGQVGEYLTFNATGTINVPAGNVSTGLVLSLGTLPAGDWDVQSQLYPNFEADNWDHFIDPVPTGWDGNMYSALGVPGLSSTGEGSWPTLNSLVVRALTSVPTPMVFQVLVASGSAASGTISFSVKARRAR
jgi:hypothetical protein